MANKSGGASKTGQAASYKSNRTWERNRLRKLRNALKSHPDNKQITEALKGVVYRRHTPKAPYWTHSMIRTAVLFKAFSGHFNTDIFSTNEKTASNAALSHRMKWDFKAPTANEKTMFSLRTRMHTGGRQWIWCGPTYCLQLPLPL